MRPRVSLFFLSAFIATTTAASAQTMNAEAFFQRGTALQRKGPFALLSRDASVLIGEGKAAGMKSRQLREAAITAGRRPRYCPPPGKVSISSSEVMQRLGAIPASERRTIDMTEATTRIFAAKFPC